MDSRHLETLLWVVRLGGIGAAAQHLNLTQPAVTRRIQELERELGAKVLQRQGRNVALTPLGQSCLERAERILSEVSMMKARCRGGCRRGHHPRRRGREHRADVVPELRRPDRAALPEGAS